MRHVEHGTRCMRRRLAWIVHNRCEIHTLKEVMCVGEDVCTRGVAGTATRRRPAPCCWSAVCEYDAIEERGGGGERERAATALCTFSTTRAARAASATPCHFINCTGHQHHDYRRGVTVFSMPVNSVAEGHWELAVVPSAECMSHKCHRTCFEHTMLCYRRGLELSEVNDVCLDVCGCPDRSTQ